jgi:polyisoprenoid-binding protein YceI
MSRSTRRRGGALVLLAALALIAVVVSNMVAAPAAPIADAARSPARATALDDALRVDLVPGGSEARYRAQEVLVGRGFAEAVGRTRDVTGGILLDAAGTVMTEQSRVTIDLRTLQSDERMRDNYARRTTLQTDVYPTADFVIGAAPGLPSPLPATGPAAFQLVGDLTIHGVTRPVTWQVNASFEGGEVTGTATTDTRFTDFAMEPPRAGPVLSIEDALRLEIDFRASVLPVVSLAD